MSKPRSRKPVEIPSFEPVDPGADARRRRRGRAARAAAGAVARASRLRHPRDDGGVVHRRLVHRRAGAPDATGTRGDGGADARPSTFRGATARYVAFG